MISKDTPIGAQVVCIRNGPVYSAFRDLPLPTIGGYYTVGEISPASAESLNSFAVYVSEIPPYYAHCGSIIYHVGYGLDWFRPLDKQVDLLMEDFMNIPLKTYEEFVEFLLTEDARQ